MTGFFLESARLGFRLWRESDSALAETLWGDTAVNRFITVGGRAFRPLSKVLFENRQPLGPVAN